MSSITTVIQAAGGGGSMLTHGASFTITGSGFGTKPAQTPFKYYNGNADATWSITEGDDAGYRDSGFRGVTTPHSRIPRYWAAANLNESLPYNIFLFQYVPTTSWPIDIYCSVYRRFDPNWIDGTSGDPDRQHKPWAFGHTTPWDSPYFYIGFTGVDTGGPDLLTDGYRTGLGPGYLSGFYGGDAVNPTKAWVRYEFLIRYTDQSNGYLYCWETTTLSGIGRREVLAGNGANNMTASAPSQISMMIAGYIRDSGASNYAYMTDVFLDYGPTRVVLTDTPTLSGASYCEPQPYTAWSDTSITLTANAGAVPSGTAYLHVVTGPNTVLKTQQVTVA